jgi:hypothetical protein
LQRNAVLAVAQQYLCSPKQIALVNRSAHVTAVQAARIAQACFLQVQRHLAPAWGLAPVPIAGAIIALRAIDRHPAGVLAFVEQRQEARAAALTRIVAACQLIAALGVAPQQLVECDVEMRREVEQGVEREARLPALGM